MKKIIVTITLVLMSLTSCKKEVITPNCPTTCNIENTQGITSKGSVTLVNGQATVSSTLVTDSSIIILTHQNNIGFPGSVHVNARTSGVGFNIESTEYGDQSIIGWVIYN